MLGRTVLDTNKLQLAAAQLITGGGLVVADLLAQARLRDNGVPAHGHVVPAHELHHARNGM